MHAERGGMPPAADVGEPSTSTSDGASQYPDRPARQTTLAKLLVDAAMHSELAVLSPGVRGSGLHAALVLVTLGQAAVNTHGKAHAGASKRSTLACGAKRLRCALAHAYLPGQLRWVPCTAACCLRRATDLRHHRHLQQPLGGKDGRVRAWHGLHLCHGLHASCKRACVSLPPRPATKGLVSQKCIGG